MAYSEAVNYPNGRKKKASKKPMSNHLASMATRRRRRRREKRAPQYCGPRKLPKFASTSNMCKTKLKSHSPWLHEACA